MREQLLGGGLIRQGGTPCPPCYNSLNRNRPMMTKQLLISQLRLGKDGSSILSILDALCNGMDSGESRQDNVSTLDEIQF